MKKQSDSAIGKEFFDFVNDKFNWKNSNYEIMRVPKGYYLDNINSKLSWTPEDNKEVYSFNSMGYRTEEFAENRKMVFAGCSQSVGEGVVYDGVWGNILSKTLGLDSYNLSISGASTQLIVQNLIGFFKTYGNPEFLFCLFPEFTRIQMKSNLEFMKSRYEKDKYGRREYSLVPNNFNPEKDVKYSKAPHIAEDIIPSELLFSINLDYIRMLELYCKLNKINFRWGTWDGEQDSYLNDNISKMDFKDYVYLEQKNWHDGVEIDSNSFYKYDLEGINFNSFYKYDLSVKPKDKDNALLNCNEDFKNEYKKNFNIAMDDEFKIGQRGHFPVHKHIHIAEAFERSLHDKN